jgi:acetyltransferase-like isoleucine patch superfamily enzyme
MNPVAYAGKLGDLPPTVGLPRSYFDKRGCVLDCRGPLFISAKSRWGFSVQVLTQSHDISKWPESGAIIPYGVTVEDEAWIFSFSLLTGCVIGAGSIVTAGTVVRGQIVAPNVMVAGNPARVIARWNGEKWCYLSAEASGFCRDLQ